MKKGASILEPTLAPHGFIFSLGEHGRSSGGWFVQATWAKGNRSLHLSLRYSLGLVVYQFEGETIGHEYLMWASTGKRRASQYPGTSDDPLDGFRHLRADLEQHAAVFISGSDTELSRLFQEARKLHEKWENMSPLQRLDIE